MLSTVAVLGIVHECSIVFMVVSNRYTHPNKHITRTNTTLKLSLSEKPRSMLCSQQMLLSEFAQHCVFLRDVMRNRTHEVNENAR